MLGGGLRMIEPIGNSNVTQGTNVTQETGIGLGGRLSG